MAGEFSREEEKVLLQKAVRNMAEDPRLNAWERDFLASISSQLLSRNLSEKQMAVLNKIKKKYKKV